MLVALGESIKYSRELRMVTLAKLARETDLNPGTLRSIEKGSPTVSIGSYLRVMVHLGFINRMSDVIKLTKYLR